MEGREGKRQILGAQITNTTTFIVLTSQDNNKVTISTPHRYAPYPLQSINFTKSQPEVDDTFEQVKLATVSLWGFREGRRILVEDRV
jgi:hypothetical protein